MHGTPLPRWLGIALLLAIAVLNFEPIAVLFLAWTILGQSVAPLQLVGAVIVIGAIIALGTARRQEPSPEDPRQPWLPG